jgi:oxygen-dependent protoporphyrinogen oxidase
MRVAVLGGGIAGLSAAHRLVELAPRTVDVVLVEKQARLGGALHTVARDGYLIETGADMFITDKPWAVALSERLGLAARLVGTDDRFRRSLVLSRGRPVPVPEGFVLMAPTRIGPILKTPLLSPLAKLRMAAEVLVARRTEAGEESLASFVRRRFGAEVLDRIVQPLVAGIYTADAERLSMHAALPRFVEMERKAGSLVLASLRERGARPEGASGARYGLFVAPAGGLRELVTALERALTQAGVHIRCGVACTRIEPARAGYRLSLGEETLECDALVVALPAWAATPLFERAAPDVAAALARIRHASTAVVVSGHRLADIAHPLDAFGLVVPAVERRRVIAVSFASRKFPGRAPEGRVLLRTFVGGALQEELLRREDDDVADLVREELRDLLGVRGADFFEVVRHERAMPQYEVGHLGIVAAIERSLAAHPRLALAGNAFEGVGIPDCVRSGERAAERLAPLATR